MNEPNEPELNEPLEPEPEYNNGIYFKRLNTNYTILDKTYLNRPDETNVNYEFHIIKDRIIYVWTSKYENKFMLNVRIFDLKAYPLTGIIPIINYTNNNHKFKSLIVMILEFIFFI